MTFAAVLDKDSRCVMGNLRFARVTITDAPVSSGDGGEVDLRDLGVDIKHVEIATGINKDDEELLRIFPNTNTNTPAYDEGSITVSAVTANDDGEIYVWGW